MTNAFFLLFILFYGRLLGFELSTLVKMKNDTWRCGLKPWALASN